MLLDKVRENLGFKYFNSNDLNLIFKSKSFPLKKPLQNKIFPEIKLGDFVIKLANKKSELKKAQTLRYSVFYNFTIFFRHFNSNRIESNIFCCY